jgi:hypothetical protein
MEKKTIKKTYLVEYQASYRVEAANEEEAIQKAIAIHEKSPDGIWGGYLESYEFYREDSKLPWV